MKYLFVHNAAPGQFIHILRRLLAQKKHDIVVASQKGTTQKLPCKQVVYDLPDHLNGGKGHFVERCLALGRDLNEKMRPYAQEGWAPDVILLHASRGASYFLRDLFPDARIVSFFEWYYHGPNIELFDGDFKALTQKTQTAYINSMPIIRDFEIMDAGYTPTKYQLKQFPRAWQKQIQVMPDPINTEFYCPNDMQTFEHGSLRLTKNDTVITYAARGMEHTRGFVEFMEAIAKVQAQRPDVQVVIAAQDRVCYDNPSPTGLKTYVDKHVAYDPKRTHFVGLLPEKVFCTLLQVSSLHVYLSKPFVLSWSVLNAMSCGLPVLASDTEPVREVITDGVNGTLVQQDDVSAIAGRMIDLISSPDVRYAMGQAARNTILEHFELNQVLDNFQDFLENYDG